MTTAVRVVSVRAENRTDSTDVSTPTPRLSWKSASTGNDWRQASAELELTSAAGISSAALSGRDSVLVDWPFEPLAPRQSYTLRARVTGEDAVTSDWSEPIEIVAGFLADGEWVASMIQAGAPTVDKQPFVARTSFEVTGDVARAYLVATAHGAYQASVNGTDVDDQILKPGWTSYQWHLVHEFTDVTALLTAGSNEIDLTVAGAWYTENFGFVGLARPYYGATPGVAAQLMIDYVDGSTQVVATDGSWMTSVTGPFVSASIYDGETYDATRTLDSWTLAKVDSEPFPTPTGRTAPAVRVIEEVAPVEIITTPAGKTVIDFGQNLVGRMRITVTGTAGHTITLRYAEVLEHGELGVRPLREAKATDHYTLVDGEQTWTPTFTFHGFRYAEVNNWPGTFDLSQVTAEVIHSDMERTGWFDSSHSLVNRLHENVVWGMKGNFLYLPTDCPQRDERLGWTGDIQVFTPTASFLYDADGFLSGWLEDLALEQKDRNGVVPFIVPAVLDDAQAAAAWGDAATVVPWVLYERFGNTAVLRDQFESMTTWTDSLVGYAGDRWLWEDMFQFGDWLDPDAPPERAAEAKTDPDIVASAYLYRSADFTARAAAVLGETAAEAKYRDIASKVRTAFLREYVSESGRMISDAQTSYAVAIQFDLYRDAAQLQDMGDRLAYLTRASGYHIGTGFVGTPLITDALTRTGHLDIATRLLTQTENPSWLYPVTMGATTIWERWDSMLEDGTINPGEMTSFNHYALGAVADWLHRSVAGLAPAEPGYRVLEIAPLPLDGFEFANAAHETPYGRASSGWKRDGSSVIIDVVVPANTTARVTLPGSAEVIEVGSGSYSWTVEAQTDATAFVAVGDRTPLATIIDDPEAYAAIWTAIETHDAEHARNFRKHTKWTPGRVLDETIFLMPKVVRQEIDTKLAKLNSSRGVS